MAARIVIRHLSGSKVNQVEQFPLDASGGLSSPLAELTIGREPAMSIRFDAQRDDIVSRRHAAISVKPGDPPNFMLKDLGSSNGTLLNGMRITGETELSPGDEVELGAGGPKFAFDIDPRPERVVARTRMVSAQELTTATRIINAGASEPPPSTTVPPTADQTRPTVGRNTVMRMLSEQRQSQTRIGMYALAAVLIVVAMVAGALYLKNQRDVAHQQAEQAALAQQAANAAAQLEEQRGKIGEQAAEIGLSPEKIMAKYANATVQISTQWKLKDRETGKPVFAKIISVPTENGPKAMPAFVKVGDTIRPWLTTEDEGHVNEVMGGRGNGTGFVLTKEGIIITNKHIAEGWLVAYDRFDSYKTGPGIVFDIFYGKVPVFNFMLQCQFLQQFKGQTTPGCAKVKKSPSLFTVEQTQDMKLADWFPGSDGGILFENDRPVPISADKRVLDGSSDEVLEVRFPGSRVSVNASLIRASTDADAALIKINATEPLETIPLAPDDKVRTGEQVVVLGYPIFTPKTLAAKKVIEGGTVHDVVEEVPEPTVTSGIISNVNLPLQQRGDIMIGNSLGYTYQLTVPSTHGNSGGPVFNRTGVAIGLFTYSTRESVTFAVPIKYARDLLQMQQH